MDKKTYYIAVGTGTIVDKKTDTSFEFEIEATDEQLARLQELFDDAADATTATALREMLVSNAEKDPYNAQYDRRLSDVYRMLHELGTAETKAHIEKMNVLNAPISQA